MTTEWPIAEASFQWEIIAGALTIKTNTARSLAGRRTKRSATWRRLADGSVFDLGNSPRGIHSGPGAWPTIVMTTTNHPGFARARGPNMCDGSFLNLRASCIGLAPAPPNLLLVCSGQPLPGRPGGHAPAGALCEKLWPDYAGGEVADSRRSRVAFYPLFQTDLMGDEARAHGRRLSLQSRTAKRRLYCVERETVGSLAASTRMERFGNWDNLLSVRRLRSSPDSI